MILVAIIIVMMIVVNIYIALILEKSIISNLAKYLWYISKEKHF